MSLRVRVLGSGAGGGFPQWNCACPHCDGLRHARIRASARTQSSIAVSADGARWLLLNASPDVRTQLLSFDALAPPRGQLRGSGVAAVALTNADIDHATGLLVLREGGVPPVYTTRRVREALTTGLSILTTLEAFGPVPWTEIVPDDVLEPRDRAGVPLGLALQAFVVASKPPPYMMPRDAVSRDAMSRDAAAASAVPLDDRTGDTIGLRVWNREQPSDVLAYVPGVRDLDDRLRASLRGASTVMIDGTFYTETEMVDLGASAKTAFMMGHAPISGPGGTLNFLRGLDAARKIYIHINNSNPILDEDSSERHAVEAAGVEIAYDGMEIVVE